MALAHLWPLNERAGNPVANDRIENVNGAYSGPTLGQPSIVPAFPADTCASFDGTNDAVTVPNTFLPEISDDFTLRAWIYWPGSQPGSGWVINKGSDDIYLGAFGEGQASGGFRDSGGEYQGVDSPVGALSEAGVYCLHFTHKKGVLSAIYVNGESAESGTINSQARVTSGALRIGADGRAEPSDFYSGKIARAAIYTHAMSAEEVAADFAADNADPGPSVDRVWCGAVTEDSLTVTARVIDGESVRLAVSTAEALTSPTYSEAAEPDEDGRVKLTVSGLAADTEYFYGWELDSSIVASGRGRARTAASGPASFSFAFASCRDSNRSPDVLDVIAESGAVRYLHTGDLHYRDIDSADVGLYLDAYDVDVLVQPGWQALMRAMPVNYSWDDHDYCGDDTGGPETGREAVQTAYRARVPHYPLPDEGGAIYHTFTHGRCRFVVLDTRSYRGVDDEGESVLGNTQRAWLEATLEAATEPLIFIVSSTTWNDPPPGTANGWGTFAEGTELAEWLKTNGFADRIVWLCGDAHMLAADDGSNAGMVVLNAAPLMEEPSDKGGTFSAGEYRGEYDVGQWGYVTVTDEGGEEIVVTYAGKTTDGVTRISLEASFEAAEEEGEEEGGGEPTARLWIYLDGERVPVSLGV